MIVGTCVFCGLLAWPPAPRRAAVAGVHPSMPVRPRLSKIHRQSENSIWHETSWGSSKLRAPARHLKPQTYPAVTCGPSARVARTAGSNPTMVFLSRSKLCAAKLFMITFHEMSIRLINSSVQPPLPKETPMTPGSPASGRGDPSNRWPITNEP